MDASIKLGRIWNVPIGLHWSWFLIFVLVTSSLAVGYFPDEFEDLSSAAHWSLAAVTSLLFFLSVLLHELGHVRVALRNGFPVRGVTLFLFGGVAIMERNARTPGEEFRIAIIGPIVSLVLAMVFGALWLLDRGIDYLAAPSIWLARINFLLALFNMIPGYPLDGGRVFRAIVWRITGSEDRSIRWATAAGQIVAGGFIAFGALRILTGDLGGGLWLIFIGWFLQNAANATQVQTTLERQLRGVTVRHLLPTSSAIVPPEMSLQQIVDEQILRRGRRSFIISDGGVQPVGVLTLDRVTGVPQEHWAATPASTAMTPLDQIPVIRPEMDLTDVLQFMADRDFAEVVVTMDGSVVGVLARDEVEEYLRMRSELGV